MSERSSAPLQVSRLLLRIWRILNLATGVLILAAFVASFVFEPVFVKFFSKRPPRIDQGLLMPTLRVWMILAVPMIGCVHLMLSRVLEIVHTVGSGDPFVPENTARLKSIAWCLLALELFRLVFGVLAATVNAAGSNVQWHFTWSGWVAVALVFVLAQIFEEGTRIRRDLETMI